MALAPAAALTNFEAECAMSVIGLQAREAAAHRQSHRVCVECRQLEAQWSVRKAAASGAVFCFSSIHEVLDRH